MRIPTDEAQALSSKYRQDVVVVVAWDLDGPLEVATYGRFAQAKDLAAAWGERTAKVLGFDGSTKMHEDFRATPAAQYKEKLDAAEAMLKKALRALNQENSTILAAECAKTIEDIRKPPK